MIKVEGKYRANLYQISPLASLSPNDTRPTEGKIVARTADVACAEGVENTTYLRVSARIENSCSSSDVFSGRTTRFVWLFDAAVVFSSASVIFNLRWICFFEFLRSIELYFWVSTFGFVEFVYIAEWLFILVWWVIIEPASGENSF